MLAALFGVVERLDRIVGTVRTTQQEAREIQGAQNVLDYSIRQDPQVAEMVTVGVQ